MLRDKMFLTAVCIVFFTIFAVFTAPWLLPHPLLQQYDKTLLPPFHKGHLLGTDHLGRDVLSRVVHGASSSLTVALVSAGIAMIMGAVMGLTAAAVHNRIMDRVFRVVTDSLLAIPAVVLTLAAGMIFSTGVLRLGIILGVIFAPVMFRVVRITARTVISTDYYAVSCILGSPWYTRAVYHLLPSIIPQVLIQGASFASIAIGTEALLSFLGLGVQPPAPSWGIMLSDARRYLFTAPYLSVFPGIAVALQVFAFQAISDYFSKRWLPNY